MSRAKQWPYSRPEWWISAIHRACADQEIEQSALPDPASYFASVKDGLAGTLKYLSGRPNLQPELVRRSLFFAKALKKWRLPVDSQVSPQQRAENAMAGFSMRNCAIGDAQQSYIPVYIYDMQRLLARWLPEPCFDNVGKFGPGACAEHYSHPQRFIRLTDWLDAGMDPLRPTDWFCHADTVCTGVSRLCAVPKDWDKDRLITVEPALNTYTQQYARSVILESIHKGPLRGSAMDLGYTDGQAIQRRLALVASRTGRDATIDLSDASDNVSWLAVQSVFPTWVTDLLWACRTPCFEGSGGDAAGRHRLHIYAGMGNATTFVIETLFFSAYVAAFQRNHGQPVHVSAFGDDIITDSTTTELLLEEGITPFFRVNATKSFWGGSRIRESCGIFAYQGIDVTVPKIDGYLPCWEGRLGLADLHKRLCASRDVFQHLLASMIAREGLLDNWPFLVDGYPSISDWSAEFSALPRSRYNTSYQRKEVQVKVVRPRTIAYPCEDSCVDQRLSQPNGWEPSPREAVQLYRRGRYPESRVWLDAVLSGARSTGVLHVKKPGPQARSSIAFPTGKYRLTNSWCCTVEAGTASQEVRPEGKWQRAADFDRKIFAAPRPPNNLV